MDVRRAIGLAKAAAGVLRRELFVPAADFLYPPVCLLCEDPFDGSGAAVCRRCWDRFTPVTADDEVWRGLRESLRQGGAVEELTACWLFEPGGALKDAIHLLKYRRIRTLGLRMGMELGRKVAADPRFASAELLVPVPLHRTRRRERGYNQCDLLCEGIARATGIRAAFGLLERPRYTQSQTLLEKSVRKTNVAGAFRIDPARRAECAGRRIILVDDVMTTGATLTECAMRLRGAGARSVLAACVALAR